jgi:hypothetical protein
MRFHSRFFKVNRQCKYMIFINGLVSKNIFPLTVRHVDSNIFAHRYDWTAYKNLY